MTLSQKEVHYIDSFISGGIAGMIGKTTVAPIDRIKIMFQTTARKFTYKEGLKDLLYIYHNEGIRGLWRGNFVTMLQVFPYTATQFLVFDFFQMKLSNQAHSKFQKGCTYFLAGSIAGISATFMTYPAEFLRTRMAMQRDKIIYTSLTSAIKDIYMKEGLRGFYRGGLPSFGGVIPYNGSGFLMFYLLKDKMKELNPELSCNKKFDFIFGAISGLTSQLVSYPLDTLRKKMQAESFLLERKEILKKKSLIGWTKHIFLNEGVKGFYKGVTINMIKGPIASGTCFTIKNFLNRKMDKAYFG